MDPLTLTAIKLAASFAPSIIGYFKGDNAADVASKVIAVAQTVTGTVTPDAAVAALNEDPALAREFQLKVMQQEAVFEQMYLADVQSARARDIELAKVGHKNRRADIMLALTYLGIVALISVMLIRDIDANSALGGIVILVIGKLISQWETGFSFEFGTTRANKTKDDTINQLSK